MRHNNTIIIHGHLSPHTPRVHFLSKLCISNFLYQNKFNKNMLIFKAKTYLRIGIDTALDDYIDYKAL